MAIQKNIGSTDRTIRIIAAVAFLVIAALGGGGWWILGIIGIILLITVFIGWCPPYSLFGISTNKGSSSPEHTAGLQQGHLGKANESEELKKRDPQKAADEKPAAGETEQGHIGRPKD